MGPAAGTVADGAAASQWQGRPLRHDPATRRPRSAETRAKLLRSALRLFSERGFHGAGTNDIAGAAGLSGPSIYRHFASKEEILVAAVLEGSRRLGESTREQPDDPDPVVALEWLCRAFVAGAMEDPDLYCVYFYEARHVPPGAKASLEASARRYVAHYEGLVQRVAPTVPAAEVTARVQAAMHVVAGFCVDAPDALANGNGAMLTQRMLAVMLGEAGVPAPATP
ncbi:MAG TPA: TetR/AcrR family transcriptional regulator [Acidimicrobiales bacterium]|nr:TetR/AcrR family transcriptional regulator [Acidimicrobiales bacterium]